MLIWDLFSKQAEKRPDDIFCWFDNAAYTWSQIRTLSERTAARLSSEGVKPGCNVALWGVNSVEWIICFFAVQRCGGTAVLLNPAYRERELTVALEESCAEILIIGELKNAPWWDGDDFSLHGSPSALTHTHSMRRLTDCSDPLASAAEAPAADEDRIACILFTSGTTARPKGVPLSHFSLLENARQIVERAKWTDRDIFLIAMPMFHCSGLTSGLLLSLYTGAPFALLRSYHSRDVLSSIEQYRCTAFNAVPSMLQLLMRSPERTRHDLSSWESGIISGAAVSQEQYQRFTQTFSAPHLMIAYGQTECAPLVTMSCRDEPPELSAGTAGKPLPWAQVRIWDKSCRREAAAGCCGEIEVKGPCAMRGYYRHPDKNRDKFTQDGWMRTGDLGFMDENGYLHFIGRKSETIIRGGENISPAEIEASIARFDASIFQTKVLGIEADEIMQEYIVAYFSADKEIETDALRRFLKNELALYKIPQYFFQIPSFPETRSGKIDQCVLKRMAEQQIHGNIAR